MKLTYQRGNELREVYGNLHAIGGLILVQRVDGGYVCVPGPSMVEISESAIAPAPVGLRVS